MHTSFSHGAPLSPKRPRQHRRDSGVSAAMWEWPHPTRNLFSHGASQSPKRPMQNQRDSGVSAVVWEWLRLVRTLFSHRASLSPKRPRQDRRDSGVSAAVWEWRDLVSPLGACPSFKVPAGIEWGGRPPPARKRTHILGGLPFCHGLSKFPKFARAPGGMTPPANPDTWPWGPPLLSWRAKMLHARSAG